ncbi:FkbM family methyltransferase [Pseudomonas mosselii]|uniref:FkbM family methyltransferase n=1 Tax=Pseudomonas mosselii TaxID=78327 RepID=UPI000BB49B50|nr:FkbM family methyltransferase [Pseudomonas mosselii]ATB64084.1 methyltransferase [Pseudomonas mosselii]MDH1099536.1 FkbM family methyltransferase [Pseudomonas mosselii]
MNFQTLVNPKAAAQDEVAREFCEVFFGPGACKRYVLGRNIYAASVAKHVEVDAFIDDYCTESSYLGKPVVKLADVPMDALVLNVAGGRPLSARQRLDDAGLQNLDYFSAYRNAGLPLAQMRFNEGFRDEYQANQEKYAWVYDLLKDEESRTVFAKLVSFRFDYDISHLEGFTYREHLQYFEDLLALKPDGETFLDVGGFDGFTSEEFIKHCPGYKAIHVFEPEASNRERCLERLAGREHVQIHPIGLSDSAKELRFDVQGSASTVSEHGTVVINVDKLDNVLKGVAPTLIKIDIEGGESDALAGARETIATYQPRLAISVYHVPGDFWRIPEQILAIRGDYEIYLRHYTECIYETVMFFIPKA